MKTASLMVIILVTMVKMPFADHVPTMFPFTLLKESMTAVRGAAMTATTTTATSAITATRAAATRAATAAAARAASCQYT